MKNGVFWDVTPCGSLRTDLSDEVSASFIRVTRIGELGTTLAVPSNRRMLSSSETSVLTRTTRRNIPEDIIIDSHRRGNLKSYIYRVCNGFRDVTPCSLADANAHFPFLILPSASG
jgi:hypothetical protein